MPSDTHMFPSPVGGVGFPSDLAPSIIFAILYGLLLPLLGYRLWNRKSRNVLLGGSLIFGVERIVIFSLRSVQANHASARESKGLNDYMQCTIGAGFIAISQDLVGLLRAALVNSTRPSTDSDEDITSPELMSDSSKSSMAILRISEPTNSQEDQPRQRYWYRRLSFLLNIGFLGAQVPGLVGNSIIGQAMEDARKAKAMMHLRYASSAIALFFSVVLAAVAMWASAKIPRFKKNAGILILFICGLFSITTIYRLCIMYHTTISLTSTSPGSQNTPAEKAVFYVFHILPEWISVLMLLSCNVRDVFGTGMFGDDRSRDETESEKAAREAKELYKAEKKTGTDIGIYEEDFGMFSKLNQLRRCKV